MGEALLARRTLPFIPLAAFVRVPSHSRQLTMELKEASSMQCLDVLGSWQMISYQAPLSAAVLSTANQCHSCKPEYDAKEPCAAGSLPRN